jgi:hypothetical protein
MFARLRSLRSLRILFLHGSANAVFDPVSTARSLEVSRDTFGERDGVRDVFPRMGEVGELR